MKKIYLLLAAVFSFAFGQAQTASAVVFTESGEKFTLYLNGEKQNANPLSNVKITGLTGEYYQARVDFEDAKLADFSNNNFAVQKGVEATYIIKINKKGEYVMRFHSQAGQASSPVAATPATEINDSKRIADVDDEPAPATQVTSVSTPATSGGATQTTTTTTTTKPVKGENVSMGVNVNGFNMGINVNIDDSAMETEEEINTSVTTTTHTTNTTTTTASPATPKEDVVIVETGRCARPMSDASFTSAKSNIESKGFEETKLTVAKQVTKANCLTTTQIKEIMGTFGFEETKLEFAKFAYDYCYNSNEYYEINDAFSFESSIDDLNTFLESK